MNSAEAVKEIERICRHFIRESLGELVCNYLRVWRFLVDIGDWVLSRKGSHIIKGSSYLSSIRMAVRAEGERGKVGVYRRIWYIRRHKRWVRGHFRRRWRIESA